MNVVSGGVKSTVKERLIGVNQLFWFKVIIDQILCLNAVIAHGLSMYEVSLKNIGTEAVFTKTEMNDEWNVNFLQNTWRI